MNNKKNNLKKIIITGAVLGGVYSILQCIAKTRVDAEESGQSKKPGNGKSWSYESAIKPQIDRLLSFAGLVILFPLYLGIAAAIYLDDRGPVFFVQERVGKDKKIFQLHKFRTMKVSAPHNIPTHQLDNPKRYITKTGRILRKYSLDELPQIWDIFRGKMSIIGPRPALWNQDDLVAERDRYKANSVYPGLTGWAQINGRDELDIINKAKLDGEYVRYLKQGGGKALLFDVKCFVGTIGSALHGDGVVEGGTEENRKKDTKHNIKASILVVCQYYYPENFQITPLCEALADDGYEITVLTGLPNYPSGTVPAEYKRGHRDEFVNGVHVIRCYETGRKKGVINLAINYVSFAMASLKKAGRLTKHFDLVFCYQLSPVLMGLPALKCARKQRVPFLLYCCDIWPESVKMYVCSEKNPVFMLADYISKKVYRSSDYIIVQSESFTEYLTGTHKINKDKITYIPAFAEEIYLESDFTPEDDTVDFVFLGNLGIAQDLFSVLEAIKNIKDTPNFKVHFVGSGTCLEEMKAFVKKEGLETIVKFYGRRSVRDMPVFYKIADVCLVSLKHDNATGLTLPSKVQGYMAAGKPVLAMIDGSAKDVINESGCGICVEPGNINALSEAMKEFIGNMGKYRECGKKGREYFKKNFSKNQCVNKLESVINQMIQSGEKMNVVI